MSDLPEGQSTAVSVVVAPERLEDVVAAIPPDKILGFIWWCQTIAERANAARKAALIEATVYADRGELLENTVVVGGHRHTLRQDERIVWKELGSLLGMLETVHGIPGDELRAAVSEARVTDLRKAAEKIADPDLRADALESIEQARIKVPTQMALVDLDSEWRRGRR